MLTRLLFWSPRLLAVLFASFLSVFAFAGFTEGHGFRSGLLHFAHSILPALTVLAVLAIAWRWQRVGAALFLILGLAYIGVSWGRFPVSTFLAIAGPMLIVAGLFLADWKYRTGRRAD